MVKTKLGGKRSSGQRSSHPIEVVAVKEEKTLYQWEALERPYQRKDKEFWTTILSILGLVCLILFFVKEWFLIVTLLALVFLYYVLTTVPPLKTKYRITNQGVYLDASQRAAWEILRRFWFSEKWGYSLLNLETWLKFPRMISLVVDKKEVKKMRDLLGKYVPEEERSPDFLDKFSSWVAQKLPVETKPAPKKKS